MFTKIVSNNQSQDSIDKHIMVLEKFEYGREQLIRSFQDNSKNFTQFWNYYITENCSARKLRSISTKIEDLDKKIALQWEEFKSNELRLSSRMLPFYSFYLRIIRNKPYEAQKLERTYLGLVANDVRTHENITHITTESINDQSNVFLKVEFDKSFVNRVKHVSRDCQKSIGWTQKELLNRDMNQLLPGFLAKSHIEKIKESLQSREAKELENVDAFIIRNDNTLLKCFITVKLSTQIQDNIGFIVLLRPIYQSTETLILDKQGTIHAWSLSIGKHLNLKKGEITRFDSFDLSIFNNDIELTRDTYNSPQLNRKYSETPAMKGQQLLDLLESLREKSEFDNYYIKFRVGTQKYHYELDIHPQSTIFGQGVIVIKLNYKEPPKKSISSSKKQNTAFKFESPDGVKSKKTSLFAPNSSRLPEFVITKPADNSTSEGSECFGDQEEKAEDISKSLYISAFNSGGTVDDEKIKIMIAQSPKEDNNPNFNQTTTSRLLKKRQGSQREQLSLYAKSLSNTFYGKGSTFKKQTSLEDELEPNTPNSRIVEVGTPKNLFSRIFQEEKAMLQKEPLKQASIHDRVDEMKKDDVIAELEMASSVRSAQSYYAKNKRFQEIIYKIRFNAKYTLMKYLYVFIFLGMIGSLYAFHFKFSSGLTRIVDNTSGLIQGVGKRLLK